MYSGNVNLTTDIIEQLKSISESKYKAIKVWEDPADPTKLISSIDGTVMWDPDMTTRNSWLYMNQSRLWYWNKTLGEWRAYISNAWEMWLGSVTGTNYLHWDWNTLDIRGNISAENGNFTGDITSDAIITGWVFRTSSSNQRIEINEAINSLAAYDSTGAFAVNIGYNPLTSFNNIINIQAPNDWSPWFPLSITNYRSSSSIRVLSNHSSTSSYAIHATSTSSNAGALYATANNSLQTVHINNSWIGNALKTTGSIIVESNTWNIEDAKVYLWSSSYSLYVDSVWDLYFQQGGFSTKLN
jgi:hypothetical protein